MHLLILKFATFFLCTTASFVNPIKDSSSLFEVSRTKRSEDSENDDCKVENIAPVSKFDMEKFKGDWYVTYKMVGGYSNLGNGMWRFYPQAENYYGFFFTGRNEHLDCIRPISGRIKQTVPGIIKLIYRTYSFKVREKIQVIYTDYTDAAAIYSCQHILQSGKCHPAGLHVEVWSRNISRADSLIAKEIRGLLQKVCVHVESILPQESEDQCNMDEIYGGGDPFQKPAPDFCYLPPKIGSCKGSVLRFFFNPKSGNCEKFTFGGCDGNSNNFMKQSDCETTCINVNSDPQCRTEAPCGIMCPPCCKEDLNGCLTCDCEKIIIDPAYPCTEDAYQCPSHCPKKEVREGCTICQCENDLTKFDNICTKPAERGTCKGIFVRFFYNSSSEKCEEFLYGGCNGNENKFETEEECNKVCQDALPSLSPAQELCLQPQKQGICRGHKLRFFYNAKTLHCEPFYYTGCGGNKNNFHSEALCYHRCNGTQGPFQEVAEKRNSNHTVVISCLPSLLSSMILMIGIYYKLC